MKLSIIIPTFNEERTVRQLIERILAVPFPVPYELIVVDDHSRDRTFAIERELRAVVGGLRMTLLRNRTNKGKGACIRQGLKHATGDWIIIQDGDLEYDPAEIPKLLEPVLQGRAQAVFGSRFRSRGWPDGMALPNFVANRILTWLANALYGARLTDLMTCYKVLPRELLTRLKVRANRFEFDCEMTAKIARRGVQIIEVPIMYHGRTAKEGKKIRAKDFFITSWTLLRYRC